MAVLLLRLAGPMQSWGDSSRFTRRMTRREPTKSGVVGLLAASLGRSREDSVEDLAQLELVVRVDQPGEIIRDFQTERTAKGAALPLTHRYYLSDAKFLVGLGGPEELLEQLEQALRHPKWPLYLGRRSCPPDQPLIIRLVRSDEDVREVVAREPWQASATYQRVHAGMFLDLVCDARDGEACESCADYPLSYSLTGRRYACRPVARFKTDNPKRDEASDDAPQGHVVGDSRQIPHDPMAFL